MLTQKCINVQHLKKCRRKSNMDSAEKC